MATTDVDLGSGTISDTDLNEILSIDQALNVIIYSCVFTNLSSNIITIDIYLASEVDQLFETVKIPAGSGKALVVSKLSGVTLNGGQGIRVQASSKIPKDTGNGLCTCRRTDLQDVVVINKVAVRHFRIPGGAAAEQRFKV